jgi:hypothetical protein
VTRVVLAAVVAYAVVFVHSAPARTPARLGVTASEYHLVLSRAAVKAGTALIELDNAGQDPHDLRLRRIGGTRTYAIALTGPGKRRTISLKLLPGRYRLWCSVLDHAQLGMQAVLRVRR